MTHSIFVRAASAIAVAALVATSGSTPVMQAQGDANQLVPVAAYKDLKWRSVGATRGGRVTAYSGVRQQPHTFYFGGVGGGVWKTDDAGMSWRNISDGFFGGSIGAVDIADSDPNVIYVGTGSADIRGNSSAGRGVWKSLDAGATWSFIGLPESGAIRRIEDGKHIVLEVMFAQ